MQGRESGAMKFATGVADAVFACVAGARLPLRMYDDEHVIEEAIEPSVLLDLPFEPGRTRHDGESFVA